jgi:hypothetical protein
MRSRANSYKGKRSDLRQCEVSESEGEIVKATDAAVRVVLGWSAHVRSAASGLRRKPSMLRMLIAAFIAACGVSATFAADKPEIKIEDLLKLFKTKIAEADAMKCTKLEDALELAAIFAKDGLGALADHKKDGCGLLEDIGASNRDPAKLAKASVKVHPGKAPVFEFTGKTEFVDEDEDVTVYVLLLKPSK